MHEDEVLVNCLGGLSLPRKSVFRLTDLSVLLTFGTIFTQGNTDMTLDVYRGRKTTVQQQQRQFSLNGSTFEGKKSHRYRALDEREYLVIIRDNFC